MTGSGVVYARQIDSRSLTFDFAEGLLQDNLLLVDRETRSVWSQLHGKAVSGPLKEAPLVSLPSLQTTWSFWRERHPDTRVMVLEGAGRPYVYRKWDPLNPGPKTLSGSHDTTNLGLGLVVENEAVFYPFVELARAERPLSYHQGGKGITIHYQPEAMTAWAVGSDGRMLAGVLAYRKGWFDFNPESKTFHAANPPGDESPD